MSPVQNPPQLFHELWAKIFALLEPCEMVAADPAGPKICSLPPTEDGVQAVL